MLTTDYFNKLGVGHLPEHLGILVTHVGPLEVTAELLVRPELMAPNGFLHAGSIVTLADTCSAMAASPVCRRAPLASPPSSSSPTILRLQLVRK